jgi:hypothetical protein
MTQQIYDLSNFSSARIKLLFELYEINTKQKRFAYIEELKNLGDINPKDVRRVLGRMSGIVYGIPVSQYSKRKNRGIFQDAFPGIAELNLSVDEPKGASRIIYALNPAYYPQIEEMRRSETSKTGI